MSEQKLINVEVLTTEETVFQGEVDRISSFNEVGAFDIYPMHANFISIIGQKLALYNKGKIVKEVEVEKAVIKVKKDTVYIFLGMEVLFMDEADIVGTENASKK